MIYNKQNKLEIKNLIAFLALGIAIVLNPVFSKAQAAGITNSIGMEFKQLPAGKFYMGSCVLTEADIKIDTKRQFMGLKAKGATCPSKGGLDPEAYSNEAPQHLVSLTNPFQIGIYEVTIGQFKKYISNVGRDDLLTDDFIKYNSRSDDVAVSWVSWQDAQDFIQWLNEKEGNKVYRLPTEAEWEYAARGKTNSFKPWGNGLKKTNDYAWYSKNVYDQKALSARKVGHKKPNPWGLFDMQGNVKEWVEDKYSKQYYKRSPRSNPKGPKEGLSHVIRGGGWMSIDRELRSAYRLNNNANYRNDDLGFRLVR